VQFTQSNLLEGEAPADDLDVIYCRNVFIYFDSAAITRTLETFIGALAPDGVLVLGPSDPLVHDSRLSVDSSKGFVVYRRATPASDAADVVAALSSSRDPTRPTQPVPTQRLRREPTRRKRELPRPKSADVQDLGPLERARVLADRGELEAAWAALEPVGEQPEALLLRALVAQGLGDHASALRDVRHLGELASPPALACIIEAHALLRAGDTRGARQAVRRGWQALSAQQSPAGAADRPQSAPGSALAVDELAALRALDKQLAHGVPTKTRIR
jgi:hypothetical protein